MLRYLSGISILISVMVLFVSWVEPKERGGDAALNKWVDSVFSRLSEEQKVGQLFMVAAYSNKDAKHVTEIEKLVTEYNIGGLIFFQGGPVRQAVLTNHYQKLAKVPLFIAMDAEWGLGMRLDSTISYPKQMTLGAIQDNKYVYKMGEEIARQCRRLGVQINFAPVVDVNSNPANPVIGIRSFGEDKQNVAAKGVAYMKGMQDHGVMANAKHFPGHGDAGSDSHLTLPVINHSKDRLQELELYPFYELIREDVKSIMVAHLHVPAYDNTPNLATTLSKAVVTNLLKEDMKFQGLIFTDALNMKGVANFYKPGEVDVLALLAGNDVLLYPEDVPTAVKRILKAIKKGEISQAEVDRRVKKILSGKYWAGLDAEKFVKVDSIYDDLNSTSGKAVQHELYEKALTLVKNTGDLIPFTLLDTTSFASVSIGADVGNEFQKSLSRYAAFSHYAVPNKHAEEAYYDQVLQKLSSAEVIMVGVHATNPWNSRDYGLSDNAKKFLDKLYLKNDNVIVSVFGTPYSLKFFSGAPQLICAYEDNAETRNLVPQLIFGAIPAMGKLPVSVLPDFPINTGIETPQVFRLRYGYPENAGLDGKILNKIDSIALKSIADQATPGCQILIAKDGKVVYNKSFGHYTYDSASPVTENTIYDIASITKVAGTLQAVMFLYDRGLLDLDKKASYYLSDLKGTNKEDLILKDILTHQAGLIPYIPHWRKTIDSGAFNPQFYSNIKSKEFPNEVCEGLFASESMSDTLWKWTVESDLLRKRKREKYGYVYSDLGFYIMKRIAESLLNQPIAAFMEQNFYNPLGLTSLTYRPLEKYSVELITPTENDVFFRHKLVRGTVHDQGAAMLGGVGGHAGLFSNATDLAVLLQMNLQNGYYGGQRYFLPETIPYFSKKQYSKNRRGLGWDKPEPEGGGPTSDFCSPNTFGHTGFTGTAAWIDPDHNLVYVFLSNRIYPDCSNTKLIRENVRTNIQDLIYKSILQYSYEQ